MLIAIIAHTLTLIAGILLGMWGNSHLNQWKFTRLTNLHRDEMNRTNISAYSNGWNAATFHWNQAHKRKDRVPQ